jgi:hypothetical protein
MMLVSGVAMVQTEILNEIVHIAKKLLALIQAKEEERQVTHPNFVSSESLFLRKGTGQCGG